MALNNEKKHKQEAARSSVSGFSADLRRGRENANH